MKPLTTDGISAKLLLDAAERQFVTGRDDGAALDFRYVLMCDLYIKARSYALMNKPAFWLSMVFALAVICWPLLGAYYEQVKLFQSTVALTTLSALFALSFALYSTYRKRQTSIESLMRIVLFSNDGKASLSTEIAKHLQAIDAGFDFQSIVDAQSGKDVVPQETPKPEAEKS
ncbi:hypothetical protein [Sagittula sp. S175]|uniref:hypothetical protein n=1 Tax=Sagittula sp. S175 TaxID=3415129 RepID=UPI003C799224